MISTSAKPTITRSSWSAHGPTGVIAASLLGDRNIRTLAIDRQRDVYDKPRAIAIDHEILRLLDNIGAAERVLPYIAPFPASQHFGARGQLIRRIDMVAEPYPLGYTPSMVFTQPPVEAALRAHAAAYDSVEVELGTELVGFDQSPDHVTLHLRDDKGATRSVTADYMIACDGASSGTRQALGIAFEDLVFDEPWLVVDLRVNDAALGKLPETAAQFCDPSRPTSFIVGPGNHRRFEIMLLPGEDPRRDGATRLRSGGFSPDGSRRTTLRCGVPRATGFMRSSPGNGDAVAYSWPATPRISSRPLSARACARAFATSETLSGSSTGF